MTEGGRNCFLSVTEIESPVVIIVIKFSFRGWKVRKDQPAHLELR